MGSCWSSAEGSLWLSSCAGTAKTGPGVAEDGPAAALRQEEQKAKVAMAAAL